MSHTIDVLTLIEKNHLQDFEKALHKVKDEEKILIATWNVSNTLNFLFNLRPSNFYSSGIEVILARYIKGTYVCIYNKGLLDALKVFPEIKQMDWTYKKDEDWFSLLDDKPIDVLKGE